MILFQKLKGIMLVKFKDSFGEVSLNGFKDKFLFPINRYNGSGKSSNGDIYINLVFMIIIFLIFL